MGEQSALESLATIVVDDDPYIVNLLRDVLAELGVKDVRAATSGDAAMRQLQGRRCDLVISDVAMPGMDGVELLRHLAGLQDRPAIILISAMEPRVLQAAHQLAQSHELRIAGVLAKPIRRVRLEQLLTFVAEGTPVDLAPAVAGASRAKSMEISVEELSHGLATNYLRAHFQPIVQCRTGRTVAAEALARWDHPERGNLPAAAFVGVAERCGRVGELTRQMVDRAFEHAGVWHRCGLDIGLSLNVSALDLDDPELLDVISSAAAERGVPAASVTIEVTESRVIERLTTALETFTRLRVHGFGIALDDFGTGNNGAEQAARLPVTQLKLDPLLVNGVADDADRRGRIAAAVALADQLDLGTVAEGVERLADLDVVAQLGVHLAQGRAIAAPMPPADIAERLTASA